jgi:hypothetical protein
MASVSLPTDKKSEFYFIHDTRVNIHSKSIPSATTKSIIEQQRKELVRNLSIISSANRRGIRIPLKPKIDYSQVSEKRKNVYQPPYKRNKTYTPSHSHQMPRPNGPSIKNYNCSICNANYKSKEYLGSEPKCFKCRNIH